jgi:OmpA-OmpF porin, OOP family
MTTVLTAFSVAATLLAAGPRPDVKGSQDHPLVSRMPDYFISYYKDEAFASEKLVGLDKKPVAVEGRRVMFTYTRQTGTADPGTLGILRNYENAVKQLGGQITQSAGTEVIGVVSKDGGEVWVRVKCAGGTYYYLTIVEKKGLEQAVVTNAQALAAGLSATGQATVQGIFFDSGKAAIKPESEAAIAEIAKLLAGSPEMKVAVVGHTDGWGDWDANMRLSEARASAVMAMLASKFGVAAERLTAFGNGSYAPVASNATDEGRARNRRVVIVQR